MKVKINMLFYSKLLICRCFSDFSMSKECLKIPFLCHIFQPQRLCCHLLVALQTTVWPSSNMGHAADLHEIWYEDCAIGTAVFTDFLYLVIPV